MDCGLDLLIEFQILRPLFADVQPVGRQVALFGVVHALTQRLRSVFVPYFRYVLDSVVAHLTSDASEQQQPLKKKRRKSKAVEISEGATGADAQQVWRLRFRVRFPAVSTREA